MMEVSSKYFRIMGAIVWGLELIIIVLLAIRTGILMINSNDIFKISISFGSIAVTFLLGTAIGFLFFSQASDLENFD